MSSKKYKELRRHEDPHHARLLNFSCFKNQPFLTTDRSRAWFCNAVIRASELHEFHLWAYAIMPDHVHLLLWPKAPVFDILRSIKQSVAKCAVAWAKSERHATLARMLDEQPNGKRAHRFWQRGGGFDRNLWEPDPIWHAIDYIHMNPVKAGLCTRPRDWHWSSASRYAGGDEGPIPIDTTGLPPRPANL